MNFCRSPKIKLSPTKSLVSRHITAKVAHYSCRGPNSVASAILKVICVLSSLFAHAKVRTSFQVNKNLFGDY